jgi:hypothetical protein
VVDTYDDDLVAGVIDPVQDSIGAASSEVDAGEVSAQWLADPAGVFDQRAGQELDDGRRHRFR